MFNTLWNIVTFPVTAAQSVYNYFWPAPCQDPFALLQENKWGDAAKATVCKLREFDYSDNKNLLITGTVVTLALLYKRKQIWGLISNKDKMRKKLEQLAKELGPTASALVIAYALKRFSEYPEVADFVKNMEFLRKLLQAIDKICPTDGISKGDSPESKIGKLTFANGQSATSQYSVEQVWGMLENYYNKMDDAYKQASPDEKKAIEDGIQKFILTGEVYTPQVNKKM